MGGSAWWKMLCRALWRKGSRDLHTNLLKLPSLQCQNVTVYINDEAEDLSRSLPQATVPNRVFSRGI